MKRTHNFCSANKVVFGKDSIQDLPEIAKSLGATKILVICDKGIKEAGFAGRASELLSHSGLASIEFAGAEPEPALEVVDQCVDFAKSQSGIDCVVGIGGGSTLDLGKLVATVLRFGGTVRDYLGENKVPGPILPYVAIPTTSGTGSEVSPAALFTDVANQAKIGASDDRLRPAVALVDPMLTLRLPAKLTAMTGMDALGHAVEAFMGKPYYCIDYTGPVQYHGSSPITDAVAIHAIKLIGKSLRTAVHQGLNIDARVDMAYASLLAGMAFTNAGTGAVHALALPLGAKTHAPHGLLVGMLLPAVIEFNMPVSYEKGSEIAAALGEDVQGLQPQDAGMLAVEAVRKVMKDIEFPTQLRSLGLAEADLPGIAKQAAGITRVIRANPRACDANALERVLTQLLVTGIKHLAGQVFKIRGGDSFT